MPIADARKFLIEAMQNDDLRKSLNRAEGQAGRDAALAEAGFRFTGPEFEEAWRHELTECQSHEMAEQLQQINQWWEMLHHFD